MDLTDEQWAVISSLLPDLPRRRMAGAGRGGRVARP